MLKIAVMALVLALAAGAASAAGRYDPYKSYRFVVYRDGHPVAGANHVDLRASGEVVKHRNGGDPGAILKSPGRDKYAPITLERGVTHDSGFANWAGGVGGGPHASLGLKSFDAGGRVRASYALSNCSTPAHNKLPPLNGKSHDVAIEHLELACENVTLARPPRK